MNTMNKLKDQIHYLQQRLKESNIHNFNFDFKEFYDFITKNNYTSSMIRFVHSNIDFEKLQKDTEGNKITEVFRKYRIHQLTINSKYERFYYLFRHLKYINNYCQSPYGYVQELNLKQNDSVIEGFVKVCVSPICDFLTESLFIESQVLAILLRYKKFREWFDRKEFFESYEKNDRTEYFLDMDLRKFLFLNGIEYPFSSPKSPSGRTDIVANLDTNDPLVLEVKIIDHKKGYYKSRISDGFKQCLKYADNYNKNVGYLIVFNADNNDKEIVFETENSEFPTKVNYNGKDYFILVININPNGKSASNIKKLDAIKTTINELIK